MTDFFFNLPASGRMMMVAQVYMTELRPVLLQPGLPATFETLLAPGSVSRYKIKMLVDGTVVI